MNVDALLQSDPQKMSKFDMWGKNQLHILYQLSGVYGLSGCSTVKEAHFVRLRLVI